MESMITKQHVSVIQKNYQKAYHLTFIRNILIGSCLDITLILIGIFAPLQQEAWVNWMIIGIFIIVFTLITIVVTFMQLAVSYRSKVVLPIINIMNEVNQWNMSYTVTPRRMIEVNRSGAIFPSFAKVQVLDQITNMTDHNERYDLFNLQISTSSGRHQHVLFRGHYIVLESQNHDIVQIRSKGKPSNKVYQYEKQESEAVKRYKTEDSDFMPIHQKIYDFIHKKTKSEATFISFLPNEIHIAYTPKKKPIYTPKLINKQVLDMIVNDLAQTLDLIETISSMINEE